VHAIFAADTDFTPERCTRDFRDEFRFCGCEIEFIALLKRSRLFRAPVTARHTNFFELRITGRGFKAKKQRNVVSALCCQASIAAIRIALALDFIDVRLS